MELKTLLDYNTLLTSPRVIKDLTPSMRESFLQLNADVHHNLITFFPNARILGSRTIIVVSNDQTPVNLMAPTKLGTNASFFYKKTMFFACASIFLS